MLRIRLPSLALSALLAFGIAGSAHAKKPVRIIPLLPSIAEIVIDLGVPENEIVGVSEYTDFPLSLKQKPSVGMYTKPSFERILELKPDLVIASRDGTPKEVSSRLEKLKIPFLLVGTETVGDIREAFTQVASALGRDEAGKSALSRFEGKLTILRARAEKRGLKSKPRVLLQVGEDPLVVAAGRNFLNEGLTILGAENAYADPTQSYPRVSVEDVIRRDPEVMALIAFTHDRERFEKARKRWEKYPNLKAVKSGRLTVLRSDGLVRPGPRFPDGLADLERAIYGEAAL